MLKKFLITLACLYKNPNKYFQEIQPNESIIKIAILFSGMLYTIRRISSSIIKENFNNFELFKNMINSWPIFWITTVIIGLLLGGVIYYFNGFIFRAFLLWSKGSWFSKEEVRNTNIVLSLIYTIPACLYIFVLSFFYKNYLYFFYNESLFAFLYIFLLIIASFYKYNVSRVKYRTSKWRSIIFFLILPNIINLIGLVMLVKKTLA